MKKRNLFLVMLMLIGMISISTETFAQYEGIDFVVEDGGELQLTMEQLGTIIVVGIVNGGIINLLGPVDWTNPQWDTHCGTFGTLDMVSCGSGYYDLTTSEGSIGIHNLVYQVEFKDPGEDYFVISGADTTIVFDNFDAIWWGELGGSATQSNSVGPMVPGKSYWIEAKDGSSYYSFDTCHITAAVTPIPDIPETPNGDDEVCEGDNNNYSIVAVEGATEYQWISSAGNISGSGTTVSVTWNTSGILKVRAGNSSGWSEYSDPLNVSVYLVPVADFGWEADGLEVSFTNLSTNTNSWSWNFGDGSGADITENPVHTYSGYSSYSVTLSAGNPGCAADITTETILLTSDVADVWKDNIKIYPNPATEIINISGVTGNIEIINIVGQVVLSSDTGENVNISSLKSGTYFVRIITDSGILVKKIMLF